MMNVIKDVHVAAINNDLSTFVKKSSDPAPNEILSSKDLNGLTPLHKVRHISSFSDTIEMTTK